MSNTNSRLKALGGASSRTQPSAKKRGSKLHSRLSEQDYNLLKEYAPNRSKLVRATIQCLKNQVMKEEPGDAKYWIASCISDMKGSAPTRTFSIDSITWAALDEILQYANNASVEDSLTEDLLVEGDMPKLVVAFLKVMEPSKAVLDLLRYEQVK